MITEHKFWFDTGVHPHNRPGVPLREHEAWRGGTLQIAFYLEGAPPPGATLAYLCDDPDSRFSHQVSIKVVGGGMLSEYAVFNVWSKE